MSAAPTRKVAVTGMAAATPVGCDIEEIFVSCMNGHGSFSELPGSANAINPMRFAGICQPVDLKVLPDRKIQKATTRKDIIGIVTAIKAARSAGIEPGSVDPERFAMYTGASSTQVQDLSPYLSLVSKAFATGTFDSEVFGEHLLGSVNPMVMMQTLMNNVLCYTSIALDIRGANANFTDFQASGAQALRAGFEAICDGRADVALVGGIAGAPEVFFGAEGVAMGYLADTSSRDCDVATMIAPYDAARTGTIMSEGSAFVVLESIDHCQKRGASVHGFIDAVSVQSDGGFYNEVTTSSEGLTSAIGRALPSTDKGEEILIVGGANGSRVGDLLEAKAVLGAPTWEKERWQCSSAKGVIGELNEAGSIMNLILAMASLRKKVSLPTTNLKEIDPAFGELIIQRESTTTSASKALIPVRSVSGICSAMVVSK